MLISKRLVCIFLFIVLIATFHFSVDGQTSYYLNNFSSAQYLGNNCFRLTQNVANQRASVWYAPMLDLNQRFDISFSMYFGSVDANGADGMAFVLQNTKKDTTAIGSSGGSFAYVGLDSSFAVEFDTYQNSSVSDPAYDHIALISNGVVDHGSATNIAGPVAAKSSQVNIEDDGDHDVRVTWNPAYDSIHVYFDCELRLAVKYSLKANIFHGHNMVRWGFTGSTGGKKNLQSYCLSQSILSVLTNSTICARDTVVINAPIGSNYNWTPVTNISSVTSASPKFYPATTTKYYVSYKDPCGNQKFDSTVITVNANPPTPTITGSANYDTLFAMPATYTAYQWYKSASKLTGKTNSSLPIGTDTSTFTVYVTNANGCTSSASISRAILLPIELLKFNAQYTGKCVDLTWTTASEINNEYFSIERSKSGTAYDFITRVEGAGNSTWTINYSTVDDKPLYGISYYRLKQTDYDGNFKFSRPVAVNRSDGGKLNIISINNDEDVLSYFISSESFPVKFEIIDMNGRILLSKNADGPTGKIDFSGMSRGVYALRIINSTESISRKFIY